MKKILFIIIMMLSVLPAAEAQNVVGKWKCSQEFLHGLGTLFIQMRGRYHFKKDSTFTIKIKGRGQRLGRKPKNEKNYVHVTTSRGVVVSKSPSNINSLSTLQIRVKGTYSVSDGTISTKVAPEDVSCYVDSGIYMPDAPSLTNDSDMLRYKMRTSWYEHRLSLSNTQEETIKRDLLEVWNWNREPLEVTKKTMKVGDKAMFKR